MEVTQSRYAPITPEDIRHIAITLVNRHGARALDYADMAVDEMEEQQDEFRTEAWKALRSEIVDVLGGRSQQDDQITLH